MLDVSVAHLEQNLFEFEILQFLNLAYFLHIKVNFKPKCLNTIENHALSNQHWNSSRVDRIISDPDSESLDITFSNKNIFGYYHGTQNTSNAPYNCDINLATMTAWHHFMRCEHSLGTMMVPKMFIFKKFVSQAFYRRITWIHSVSETK